jgi:hypothetical protein
MTSVSLEPLVASILLASAGILVWSGAWHIARPKEASSVIASVFKLDASPMDLWLGSALGVIEIVAAAFTLIFLSSDQMSRLILLPGVVLTSGFLGVLLLQYSKGSTASCGCSPAGPARVTWAAFARAGFLLVGYLLGFVVDSDPLAPTEGRWILGLATLAIGVSVWNLPAAVALPEPRSM